MKISALASGSSGNCFYVQEGDSALLIDAGISCRQVISRLNGRRNIKAIFVSHEHTDHTRGADVLARALNIPIYATRGTIKNSFLCSNQNLVQEIRNDESLKIGKMEITAFPKSHDAADPISFQVKSNKTLSVITDIGYACKNVCEAVEDSDFLVIESNHDIEMLENGPYPYFLKRRIMGDRGHISNLHSGLCVLEHGKIRLKNIMLAHLSQHNNEPWLALSTFRNILRERKEINPRILVSGRNFSTSLMNV